MSVTNVMLIFFISFLYTLLYIIYPIQYGRPISLPYIMQPLSFNPYPSCRA